MDPTDDFLSLAREGHVQDGDVGDTWSYASASEPREGDLDAGYLYSRWQLLDLRQSLLGLKLMDMDPSRASMELAAAQYRRARHRSLASLAPLFLPTVVRHIRGVATEDDPAFAAFRRAENVEDLLDTAGVRPQDLRRDAEDLLSEAMSLDPLDSWWPLVRFAGAAAWERLKGPCLDALWMRVGGEMLLLAHESLAREGVLDALVDVSAGAVAHPLTARVSLRGVSTKSLEQALNSFGLSPHPRVLLMLEGQTEMEHFADLLALRHLDSPSLVRLHNCRGASNKPHLLAQYAVTPRIRQRVGDRQHIDGQPTALFIAMDPEQIWRDSEREKTTRTLKGHIREDIEAQDGRITDDDLDQLVTVRVWGPESYELANFTDDELVEGLTEVAQLQGHDSGDPLEWRSKLYRLLAEERARAGTGNAHVPTIGTVFHQIGMREQKVHLAKALWPMLREKYEAERAAGNVTTPVLQVLEEVGRLVQTFSHTGGFALEWPEGS